MPKDAKAATESVAVEFQTDVIVNEGSKCSLPPGHYVAGSVWVLSEAAAQEAIAHRWAILAPEQP